MQSVDEVLMKRAELPNYYLVSFNLYLLVLRHVNFTIVCV